MGYGGSLLWSGVIREVSLSSKKKVVLALTPGISDLVRGKLYRTDQNLESDAVFRENVRISHTPLTQKSKVAKLVDNIFFRTIDLLGLRKPYEYIIYRLSNLTQPTVHIDMAIHIYAKKSTSKRMFWKEGGHIIDIMAKPFGVSPKAHQCEIFLQEAEIQRAKNLIQKEQLRNFIVIEPHTKLDWFGDLRAWPIGYWQELVNHLREWNPNLQIVQTGAGGFSALDGVVDVSGKLSFRETGALLREAKLFIGQEGGLMHLANAVNARTLIIYGGVTHPNFSGYPESQAILRANIECSPCGRRFECPIQKKCLTSIGSQQAFEEVKKLMKGAL